MYFPSAEKEGLARNTSLPQGAFVLSIDQSEAREKFARVGLSLDAQFGATKSGRQEREKAREVKIYARIFVFDDLLA
jgi:hypothetical protein